MTKFLGKKNLIRNTLITIYIFAVLGISATSRAAEQILPIFAGPSAVQTQPYVGQVAMTVEQDFYLVVSDTEVYLLQSNIDLSPYNGQTLTIEGFELNKHKSGPVVQTLSLDPLPGNEKPAMIAPVLVVFGISGLSN